jgi:hypothetical protein
MHPDTVPPLLSKDFLAYRLRVLLSGHKEDGCAMATESRQNERRVEHYYAAHEVIFIDLIEMANIERAVAAGAGAVDQYAPTGSEQLDEIQIRTMITEALVAANVDAAKVYAFLTIGCLVTEDNASRLTTTQVAEWKKAVQDYRQHHCGHA